MLFGGAVSGGALAAAETWEYNAEADRWARLHDGTAADGPVARTGHAGGWVSGAVVLYGGRDAAGTALGEAWSFTPAAQSWSRLQTRGVTPPARAGHSCVVLNATSMLGACNAAACSSEADSRSRFSPQSWVASRVMQCWTTCGDLMSSTRVPPRGR